MPYIWDIGLWITEFLVRLTGFFRVMLCQQCGKHRWKPFSSTIWSFKEEFEYIFSAGVDEIPFCPFFLHQKHHMTDVFDMQVLHGYYSMLKHQPFSCYESINLIGVGVVFEYSDSIISTDICKFWRFQSNWIESSFPQLQWYIKTFLSQICLIEGGVARIVVHGVLKANRTFYKPPLPPPFSCSVSC